jgi:hypothetical protein
MHAETGGHSQKGVDHQSGDGLRTRRMLMFVRKCPLWVKSGHTDKADLGVNLRAELESRLFSKVSANLAASRFYRIELNDELPDQLQLLQLTGVELT